MVERVPEVVYLIHMVICFVDGSCKEFEVSDYGCEWLLDELIEVAAREPYLVEVDDITVYLCDDCRLVSSLKKELRELLRSSDGLSVSEVRVLNKVILELRASCMIDFG